MHPLDEAVRAAFAADIRVRPQHTNRASQAGIECARRLQWHRTRWQNAAAPDVSLERRFFLGRVLEPEIIELLRKAGFAIEQSQRDLTWPQFQLTGHIDGLVTIDGQKLVIDIKTASRFSFEKVRKAGSASDLLADRRSYVRGYVTQVALYALLLGLPGGLLFFFDKDSGATHTVPVMLDDDAVLEAAEATLKRFQRVNEFTAAGQDVPPFPGSHCKDCPFLGACSPQREFGNVLSILDDEEVEALLEEREANAEAASAFDEADKALKERFSAAGESLIGSWHVTVKETQTTQYDIPKDIRSQYAKKVAQLRRSYERIVTTASEAPAP